MKTYSNIIVIFTILVFILVDSIDGFNFGRQRQKRYLRKRMDKNGFNLAAAAKNLNNGYQYISNWLNNHAKLKNYAVGSSGLDFSSASGRFNTAECDDCFLGMQVSRREAYVVSNRVYFETNKIQYFIIAYHLHYCVF